jgi:1-acyl-sn-glycerol-3-phosphate acyltransferase
MLCSHIARMSTPIGGACGCGARVDALMMAATAMAPVNASTVALLASTTSHLGAYQLSAQLCGSSLVRALRIWQHWGRRACRWLRLDARVHGCCPVPPCVYVSNHRSYLDIPLLAGALGATFVSRADVAGWPLLGSAARAVGVVFVDRDDPYARVRAARALAQRIAGASVVVFPEGTTRGAPLPGPFHPGLFRLLHRCRVVVVPITIRYNDQRVYWIEELSLAQHLHTRVFRGPRLRADVHVGTPLRSASYPDATALARAAYEAVCRPLVEFGELVGQEAAP